MDYKPAAPATIKCMKRVIASLVPEELNVETPQRYVFRLSGDKFLPKEERFLRAR